MGSTPSAGIHSCYNAGMRTDIEERKSEILTWIAQNQSKAFMCRELRCKPETLNSWLSKLGIEYSGNRGGKGVKSSPLKLTAEEYAKTAHPKPHVLRLKLLENREHQCEQCELKVWNGEPIPLELHHVDGNRWNNDFVNLQILCPNCHAQTPNHAGKARTTRD